MRAHTRIQKNRGEKDSGDMATPFDHMAAGTAGGVIATVALYPLDTIRTRLQGVLRGAPNPAEAFASHMLCLHGVEDGHVAARASFHSSCSLSMLSLMRM